MSTQNNHRRREALVVVAAVCAGGAMPATWRKPLVDSVITPAHAQTSVVPDPPASQPGDNPDPDPNPNPPVIDPPTPDPGPDPDPDPGPQPPVSNAPGTLTGFVTARAQNSKDTWPVDAVEITLTSMDDGGVYSIVSGGGGLYTMDLPPGRYAISARKDGFYNWSLYPDVVTINPNGISTQNITLVSSS